LATAPANGDATGVPMANFLGIQRAAPGPGEPDDVDIPGDDTSLGAINFGPDKVPSFLVEFGAFDLAVDAALQTTTVETIGDIRLGVLQPNNPEYPDIAMILQSKSKKKDSGVDGSKSWAGYILPKCNAIPLGRESFEGRTAGNDRFKVTAQVADKKPWGVTILEADLGTDGGPILRFTSENPITQHRHTGDAATLIYNLGHTPVSQAKTLIWVDTALLVAGVDYTVVAATGVITFTAPPAAGAKIVTLYEFTA